MRSLLLLPLVCALIFSCSQNPHVDIADPEPATTTQAVTAPAPDSNPVQVVTSLVTIADRDGDGVRDNEDLCVVVPGPVANKGCPYNTVEDSDQDGVINEADQCVTVKGPVQNNGCPHGTVEDTDQDGVLNTDDRCPTEKGPAENSGCPYGDVGDADRDGTLDDSDKCPTTPGPRDNKGCPYSDRDGDGVYDQVDACPNEAGPATNRGCPIPKDSDGDGLSDNKDKCPLEAGPVSNQGCPEAERDTDRDGLVDSKDACPLEAGPIANKGCPYPKEEERRILLAAMGSLKFDFDKAVIKKESYPSLQDLEAFLKKYPESNLKLVGHTDDQGTDEYNIRLASARVKAVKRFFMDRGIAADRIEAYGRGEREPLVSISGLEGEDLEVARAQNRRVDMSVRYVEVKVQN